MSADAVVIPFPCATVVRDGVVGHLVECKECLGSGGGVACSRHSGACPCDGYVFACERCEGEGELFDASCACDLCETVARALEDRDEVTLVRYRAAVAAAAWRKAVSQ